MVFILLRPKFEFLLVELFLLFFVDKSLASSATNHQSDVHHLFPHIENQPICFNQTNSSGSLLRMVVVVGEKITQTFARVPIMAATNVGSKLILD